jgi:hypothetical protein
MTFLPLSATLAVFALGLLIYDTLNYMPPWFRTVGVVSVWLAMLFFVMGCIQILRIAFLWGGQ